MSVRMIDTEGVVIDGVRVTVVIVIVSSSRGSLRHAHASVEDNGPEFIFCRR